MRAGRTPRFRDAFDEAAVLAVLVKVKLSADVSLNGDEQLVMEAFRRSTTTLEDADLQQIHEYLTDLEVDQVVGVVNNVKGILHEISFAELENADGDTVTAALFPDTNHEGFDVVLSDSATGETWELQLKATDSAAAVDEWIDAHPGGQILVTQELAERLDLEASGFSDETLTVQVQELVDRLQDLPDDDAIWDHVPMLALTSTALVVWELWQRQVRGELTLGQFRCQAAQAAGCKAGKMALLAALLSVPVVGQVTGAVLVAKFILTVDQAAQASQAPRPGRRANGPAWLPAE